MRVLVLIKATAESEAGQLPSEALMTEMGAFNDELIKAGLMLAGEGLHPSSRGVRVAFSGSRRSVIDGPFAETKELIAGFWIWRVESMAQAIDWVRRCPNPDGGDSVVEIRPIFELADFEGMLTPELREQETRQRATIEAQEAARQSRADR